MLSQTKLGIMCIVHHSALYFQVHACDASEHEDVREKNNERQSSLACYDLHMVACECEAELQWSIFRLYSVSFQACKSGWQIFLSKQIWNQWHSWLTCHSFLVASAVMGLQRNQGMINISGQLSQTRRALSTCQSQSLPVHEHLLDTAHTHMYTHTYKR